MTTDSKNKTAARGRTRVDVYSLLKDSIQYLDFMPGTLIREVDLVEQYGVSRTPIREALLRLSTEYLIDIYPQRGTYISNINFKLARECTYMRHILDSEICMDLCRKRIDLDPYMEENLFFMSKAVKNQDVKAYIQSDNAFHNTIFEVAGHEMVWEIIANSRAHYNRVLTLDLRRPGILEKSFREHMDILKYIKSGDGVALNELMEQHHDYRDMPEREKEIREMFPEYFVNES